MNFIEKRKALEELLQQRVNLFNSLTKQANDCTNDVVKIKGKLELLKELEHESRIPAADAVKEEPKTG